MFGIFTKHHVDILKKEWQDALEYAKRQRDSARQQVMNLLELHDIHIKEIKRLESALLSISKNATGCDMKIKGIMTTCKELATAELVERKMRK